MKRLNLEDFQQKHEKVANADQTDALLGQVLGDCHDEPGFWETTVRLGEGFIDRLAVRFNLKKP